MRCYIPPTDWLLGEVRLTPEESHHLTHVLRAREGQTVMVFDGQGRVGEAEVLQARSKSGALVQLRNEKAVPRPRVRLQLVQALIRGSKMDLIVQKATELGVAVIAPVETERAVVRCRPGKEEDRVRRWWTVAVNAAKQCGTPWLPELLAPVSLEERVAQDAGADLALLCSLAPGVKPLRDVLRGADLGSTGRIDIYVGPEGDFTDAELSAITSAGATPVSLGNLTLRAETAALFAISAVSYELSGI